MSTQTATLASRKAAVNLNNIKRTVEFYRANSFPLWRVRMSAKLIRRMRPVVKRIAEKFNITPIQARSVLVTSGLRMLVGKPLPSIQAKG
jgi:hypothetical protein